MATIKGQTGLWEYVIGLEVHAQVKSNAKLFSAASTKFGASSNSQVELLDVAMPGSLPVLNEFCVSQAVKTSLGINAKVNKLSIFDRKNYFYPDLPQGYQITQFYYPIAQDGWLEILDDNSKIKTIKVNRLHLEQDAGKSIHDQSPYYSFLDFNRSGIALMEIVSDPDLSSPYEAAEYVKKLRAILRYLGTCDGDMEKGSLRCDANVSVRKIGEGLGTRCEIKNLNSIKSIIKAIEFEASRQIEVLESGGQIIQETRLFDTVMNETRAMRTKEEAHDYRYFRDPDLLPLKLTQEFIDNIKNKLPELPDAKVYRYVNDMGLSNYDAEILASDKEIANYFEEVANNVDPKQSANWILSELLGLVNKSGIEFVDSKVTSSNLSELINLINDGTISGKIAKTVLIEMFETAKSPSIIVEERQLTQVSDIDALNKVVDKVLNDNSESVAQYRMGKERLFGFFVGQVMKETKGNANPAMVNEILQKKLKL